MYKYPNSEFVSFPLGGIGTGSIGLASNGEIVDYEIFNRPARGTINPFTFFAVKAEDNEKVVDVRALHGPSRGSMMGHFGEGQKNGKYGLGKDRTTAAGMKHFSKSDFSAFFPFAEIDFEEENFPGKVKLHAYSPFIPSNADDSSLPVAIFEIEVENDTDKELDYTVAFSMSNPLSGKTKNEKYTLTNGGGLLFSNDISDKKPEFGEIMIYSEDENVSVQEYWYRGGWFDEFITFISDFSKKGKIKERNYEEPPKNNRHDIGTVTSEYIIAPDEKKIFNFFACWYFPVAEKYWSDDKPTWETFVASKYFGVSDMAAYILNNRERLNKESRLFCDIFSNQTLDKDILEAVQANLAIIKSTTIHRLADGTIYGWEGVTEKSGNCEGTCTHVWNYAYSIPYLFPKLERSIRDSELKYCVSKDGKMTFRNFLPLGKDKFDFRACVDGQFGTIIKIYREWKISGNTFYIEDKWEQIKSLIDYAQSDKNPDKWDPEGYGIISGRQHHTLDMELFGPNSWLQGMYVAALSAVIEMADCLDDEEAAVKYKKLYANAREYLNNELYNGKYFIQKIDLKDNALLDEYDMGELIDGEGYLNEETNEIKYQIEQGCEIDQVLSAWHADIIGIEAPFDFDKRKSALTELYNRNFKKMSDIHNPCRVFAADDEEGLIICSWDDENKPSIPLPYAEECMTGFEYAAACNMLQCDMEEKAYNIVRAIRKRYDGERRNPFAEIECGASYARAMASYSFILTESGIKIDMPDNKITFSPRKPGKFFWSSSEAFGEIEYTGDTMIFKVELGNIVLKEIGFTDTGGNYRFKELKPEDTDDTYFDSGIMLSAGDSVHVN